MDLIRETEFSAFSCGSSNINVVKGGFMPAKILLFEDEVSIRSVLSELLTDAGYEVVAVMLCAGRSGRVRIRQLLC